MTITLRPYQTTGLNEIRTALGQKFRAPLFVLPTGGGKCLGRGTPVLMFDGQIKPVERVAVGDLLMGPDSRPRRVLSLARGREMMYRVTPTKGDAYTVNESHILSLKRTHTDRVPKYPSEARGGEVVNVSVREYLAQSKTWKHIHKGWRTGVDFVPTGELPMPPYVLGLWLGDGSTGKCSFTSGDPEITNAIHEYAASVGARIRIEANSENSVNLHLASAGAAYGKRGSPMGNALRSLGIFDGKRIPHRYLTASREDRLDLLAGIIDTDGHYDGKCHYVTLKSWALASGVVYLARSLGFACYQRAVRKTCHNNGVSGTYFACIISGDIERIPCRIPRKRANPRRQRKSVLVTGITVEPVAIDDYFGFEIDGDRLFLLGDFTVTHNTVTYAAMAQGAAAKGNNILILEHRRELIRQASCAVGALGVRHRIIAPPDKIAAIRRVHVERLGWPMIDQAANVAVASVQTLARRMDWLQLFNPRIIIIDEAHHAVAGTWARIIEACPNAVLIGVTATPCRADGRGLDDVFDKLIVGPSMQEMIDEGYLVPYRIIVPPLQADASQVSRKGSDLDADEQAKILDKPHITGDAVKHYAEIAPGKPAIVCCTNVKHAEHVADAFKGAGWRFEVVIGDMDDDLRDRRLRGLEDGSLQGIVQVEVAGEGTDIPAAEVLIMLRLTESLPLFLQQAGRISRPVYASGFDLATREGRLDAIAASAKPYGILIDHVGNVGKQTAEGFQALHGLPTQDRQWTLEGRKRRSKAANDDEPTVRVVQCPECYGVAPPRKVCGLIRADGTRCGHVFEAGEALPGQVDGNLVEITPEVAAAAAARKAQGAARTLAQLKAMGMSDGRAAHILAAREEKDRLRDELRELMRQMTAARRPHGIEDVLALKPKALRAELERLRSELGHMAFMGANDNNETAAATA